MLHLGQVRGEVGGLQTVCLTLLPVSTSGPETPPPVSPLPDLSPSVTS